MIDLELETKVTISEAVIWDALNRFRSPALLWNTSKESNMLAQQIAEVCEKKGVAVPPALFVDHGDYFPETYEFMKELAAKMNLQVFTATNTDVISNIHEDLVDISTLSPQNRREARLAGFAEGKFECSIDSDLGRHLLVNVAINEAVREHSFDCVITPRIPADDARNDRARYYESRDSPSYHLVSPMLQLNEKDVWVYNFEKSIPLNPKYGEGFDTVEGARRERIKTDGPAWLPFYNPEDKAKQSANDSEKMKEKLRRMGYM